MSPALNHYCCFTFYVLSTRGKCITKTSQFPPIHHKISNITPSTAAVQTDNELIESLKALQQALLFLTINDTHLHTFQKLAKVFNNSVKRALEHLQLPSNIINNQQVQPTTPPEIPDPMPIVYHILNDSSIHLSPSQHTYTHCYPTRYRNVHVIPPDDETVQSIICTHSPQLFNNQSLIGLMHRYLDNPWTIEYTNLVYNDVGKAVIYKQLIQGPTTQQLWSLVMYKELGRLAQQ